MKQVIIILLFAIFFDSCTDANVEKKQEQSDFLDTHLVSITKSATSHLDFFILQYADSINNIKEFEIPTFIFNSNFDMEHVGYWPTAHTPISLREMILKKVTNCENLKKIADSKISDLDIKPIDVKSNTDLVEVLPLNNVTTRALILERLEELKCK